MRFAGEVLTGRPLEPWREVTDMKAEDPVFRWFGGAIALGILAVFCFPFTEAQAIEAEGSVEEEVDIIAYYQGEIPILEDDLAELQADLNDIDREIAAQNDVLKDYNIFDKARRQWLETTRSHEGADDYEAHFNEYLSNHPINLSGGKVIDNYKDYALYAEESERDLVFARHALEMLNKDKELIAQAVAKKELRRSLFVNAVSAYNARSLYEGYWNFVGNPSIISITLDRASGIFVGRFVHVERIEHFKAGDLLFGVSLDDNEHPNLLRGTEHDYVSPEKIESSTVYIYARGHRLSYRTRDQSLVLERTDPPITQIKTGSSELQGTDRGAAQDEDGSPLTSTPEPIEPRNQENRQPDSAGDKTRSRDQKN